jgi:general secretion pathway protein N
VNARNWIVLGVSAFAAFLVASIPATVLTPLLATHLPPTLQVRSSEGTVWRGALTLAKLARGGTPTRLTWRFRPERLLRGELAAELVFSENSCKFGGIAGRGFSGMTLSDVAGICRAERIAEWLPALAVWQPRGIVSTAGGSLALKSHRADGAVVLDRIEGEQVLTFDGIGIAQTMLDSLGTYRLELAGDGAGLRIRLATTAGPLQLSGDGRYSAPRAVSFTGKAAAERADAAALEPLLKLIGPRQPDGSTAIDLKVP